MPQHIFPTHLISAHPLAAKIMATAALQHKSPNAYLFTGRATVSKEEFARALAAYFNCQYLLENQGVSCLAAVPGARPMCQNCSWIQAGEHPQAWVPILGEGASGKVPVEKVRKLCDELTKTSRYFRVVIVPDARQEAFHRPAANALLKQIEEPPANCLFIFFAPEEEAVLPTIVSRCQCISLSRPMKELPWIDDSLSTPEWQTRWQLSKADLTHVTRKNISADNLSMSGNLLRLVGHSQELGTKLLELCEDELSAYNAIDLLIATELEQLRHKAVSDADISLYLKRAIDLSETAKRQMDSYVNKKNALEYFAFKLNELKAEYLGGKV